jgi:hypothetical protein
MLRTNGREARVQELAARVDSPANLWSVLTLERSQVLAGDLLAWLAEMNLDECEDVEVALSCRK